MRLRPRNFVPATLLLCLLWGLFGLSCVGPASPFRFSEWHDGPIPEHAAVWLQAGEQSAVTERIAAHARALTGISRRERLFRAMDYVWQSFSYDAWLNTRAFRRTAEELFESRVLGGCSDYALVEITLFRALGIPARMVLTVNVDWMLQRPSDPLSMPEGHSFIEVFLEDRWYLVDSTYRWLFSNYDPQTPSYPHGEYFCARGRDFWDMGVRKIRDLERVLEKEALEYGGDFRQPLYRKTPI